jgi:hyperosmotically inducible protein
LPATIINNGMDAMKTSIAVVIVSLVLSTGIAVAQNSSQNSNAQANNTPQSNAQQTNAQQSNAQQSNAQQNNAQQNNAEQNSSLPARDNANTTANPQGDQRIIRDVRHELLMLPYYGVFDWLQFRVNDGTVTLQGAVSRPTLKTDAERVVKKIEGVERVDNQIQVLPASPMDDNIRRAVLYRIYDQAGMQRYAMGAIPAIHIVVNNGRVTLYGIVDSDMDKQIAYTQASSVPGVFQVTNDLMVANDKAK